MEFVVGLLEHQKQVETMDSIKIWVWVSYFVDQSWECYALCIFTLYKIILLLSWKQCNLEVRWGEW